MTSEIKIRQPAVAGSFYPKGKSTIKAMIKGFMQKAKVNDTHHIISYVAPHAGYEYSGAVAAYTYSALAKNVKDIGSFVIVGPNHTGVGRPISISMQDWQTPLGLVKNDTELSVKISEESKGIDLDNSAHLEEHSIEVQLPFLQSIVKEPKCSFICMGNQSYDSSKLLCNAIIKASKQLHRKITVIASSDFNHYEPATIAKEKDMPAIKALESLNPLSFNKLLLAANDSACGFGPVTVAALYAQERGAKKGRVLKYANSGEITNHYDSVVAYASIIFL